MMKKLYTFSLILLVLLLNGCAQDDWLWDGNVEELKDSAEFTFAIPEPTVIETRDGESAFESNLNKVEILIFKDADEYSACQLLQYESVEQTVTAGTPFKIKYSDEVKSHLKNGGKVRVYAIVNSDEAVSTVNNLTELYQKYSSSAIKGGGRNGMIMSGHKDGQNAAAMSRNVEIELVRSAAKVTLDTSSAVNNFELESYWLYSSPSKGYLTAGCDGSLAAVSSNEVVNSDEITMAGAPVYGYGQSMPTNPEENVGSDHRAFMIVKGIYEDMECYYRVDFRKKNDDGTYTYLFLTPNHEYDVKIVKIKCKGYSSAAEAAKHPQADEVVVEIHDHVPAVLSMTSDGARELGVGKAERTNFTGGEYFALKLYSYVNENEYPAMPTGDLNNKVVTVGNDFKIEVIEGDWLKIKKITPGNIDESNDGEGSKTPGKLYKIELDYDNSVKLTGELIGKVRVSWHGLTREAEVIWTREFSPWEICSATLQITYSGSNAGTGANTIMYSPQQYWSLLGGIEGASKANNNGMIRNEGFHLPLYYGGSKEASKWKYKYELTLTDGVYSSGDAVSVEVEGFRGLTPAVSGNTITFEVSADQYGWSYSTGKFIIKVNDASYPFDLYHTGFLHKEKSSDSDCLNNAPGDIWNYYEVRTIGEAHWLDRNIGARSNGMAIVTNTGANLIADGEGNFNSKATGGYYKPANYVTHNDPGQNMKDICPPGFRVPNTAEWDALRNSAKYDDSQSMRGGTTYYQSKIIDENDMFVYFPKVMYYSSGLVGDSRAGYYWTKSQAMGTEKEEIGRWLRALFISGSSNSYMNGNVETYGMQIRAIEGYNSDPEPAMNTIGFKVKGATHVYIYDAGKVYPATLDKRDSQYEDDQKYGLMSWPGQAIGDASTMANGSGNDGTEFAFTYSTTSNPGDLRFLFTYVKDGKITVFCRKINGDKEGVERYNGWPLCSYYHFNNQNGSVIEIGDKSEVSETNKNYRVYIKKGTDNSRGAKLYAGSTELINADYTSSSFKAGDDEYVYYDFTSSKSFKLKWQLRYTSGTGGISYSNTMERDNDQMTLVDGRYTYTILDWNDGKSGSPNGGDEPVGNTKNYRLYVKKWQDNLDGINTWFTSGGNGIVPPKGTFNDDWWSGNINKDGTYYYIDLTIEGSFTLKWQPVYNGYWENGELKGNYGETQEITDESFIYDASTGKKVCKLTGWNQSSGGAPARRK